MTDSKVQEAWINAVKSCGQSLIDNAKSIAGDFDFQTETKICITLKPGEFVDISVAISYIPHDINDQERPVTTIPKNELISGAKEIDRDNSNA